MTAQNNPAMDTITPLAKSLDDAVLQAAAIAPLDPALTIDDAYRIQRAAMARRTARGERIVGIKMGFTSEAKMRQMGVGDQISGWLTDAMQIASGATLSLENHIHPRCEPEIAFLLKRPLPAELTEQAAFDAIEAVAPALEIIDSRFHQFKFSLTDVIADNASSSGFVLGPWIPCPPDLSGLAVSLSIDGELRQSGSTSDIMGNPLRALMAAARLAAQAGMPLQAGSIVLAGAATSAEALQPGMQIHARVTGIGAVDLSTASAAR